jgi:excisionase family DNA binding protein
LTFRTFVSYGHDRDQGFDMALSRSDAATIRAVVARLRAEHADREAAAIERLMQVTVAAPDSTAALAGYMTTGEAAGLIGVSLQTIKNWVHQGRLVGTRVGGRMLITRASVQAFFDSLGSATEPAESDEHLASAEAADAELEASLPAALIKRVEELLERADSGQDLSAAERRELRRLARAGTDAATRHTRELVSRLRHG